MKNSNTSGHIHPLLAGAAVSVMLVSLTGIAAIAGLIPNSQGAAAPTQVASSIGAAAAATSPAALVETKSDQTAVSVASPPSTASTVAPTVTPSVASKTASATTYAPRTGNVSHSPAHHAYASKVAICSSCGRIESVRSVQHTTRPNGVGVIAGGILGGLLGNQVGGGNGRTLATVAGAVGGGYAGNEVEKRAHTTITYQVRVRMEDGRFRSFPYRQQPAWSIGDRVRVINGHLTARA